MTHRLVRYEYFFVADHRPNTFDDDGFYDGLLVFGVRLVGDGISVSVLCWTVVLVCDGGGSVCLFRRLFFFFFNCSFSCFRAATRDSNICMILSSGVALPELCPFSVYASLRGRSSF